MFNFKYRRDIDGLRAIAVLAVIFYHLDFQLNNKNLFPGGYIGVDIFFVVSGYLITSIILTEKINNNAFSYLNFFERRIRRIIPPLLIVISASFFFGWFYFLPEDLVKLSYTALSSVFFFSNLYFFNIDENYWSGETEYNPLLHTWSLSVEEQFYISFPFFLIIGFKIFKANFSKIILSIIFFNLLLIHLIGNLNFNYPYLNKDISFFSDSFFSSFYMPTSRVWELLFGSYLSLKNSNKKKFSLVTINFFNTTGLIMILGSIFLFNSETYHPSIITLFPVVGSVLIIYFHHSDSIVTKILSNNKLVFLGLISYSLYLWHYPVIFYSTFILKFELGLGIKLILILTTFLLSLITYFMIEKIFRDKQIRFKILAIPIISLIFVLIVLSINIIVKEGYPKRIPEIILESVKTFEKKKLRDKICRFNLNGCFFNNNNTSKIYFVGDSHIQTLFESIKDVEALKNYKLIVYTLPGCLYFPGFNRANEDNLVDDKCNNQYFSKLRRKFLNEKDSIFIIGGRFQLYLNNSFFNNEEGGIEGKEWKDKFLSIGNYKNIKESFKDGITEISKKNKILLVYPIPEAGWHVPKKLFTILSKSKQKKDEYLSKKNYLTTSYDLFKDRTYSSFRLLDSIENDNIYRIYPHELFCGTLFEKRCITHNDTDLFYSDDDHLSEKGFVSLNKIILEKIKIIENLKN